MAAPVPLGRYAFANSTAVRACYNSLEVLFECGGAYAGVCNTTSGSCVCNTGWSGHTGAFRVNSKVVGEQARPIQEYIENPALLNEESALDIKRQP